MSKPEISSDVIELDVVAGKAVNIEHGFGRQIAGWIVIWSDAYIEFIVNNPAADTSKNLVLTPNSTASVRLVLL